MIDKIGHYSLTNPTSVYDEEALTALELAGRTAGKVNECIGAFNNLEEATNKHLADQDEAIPKEVAKQVDKFLKDGTFDDVIDEYMGEIEVRLDNIVSNAGDDNTELVDMRIGADGKTYPVAGDALRKLPVSSIHTTIEAGNYTTLLPSVDINKPSIYKLLFAEGSQDIPTGLPFSTWEGGIATLVTTNGDTDGSSKYVSQILFTPKHIYYRFTGTNFTGSVWRNMGHRREYVQSHIATVVSDNYTRILPSVDIHEASIYKLLFAKGSTDIPVGLPFSSWEGGIATLITTNSTHDNSEYYATQILFTTENIYYRYAGNEYAPWVNILGKVTARMEGVVSIGNGGSILKGLKECYAKGYKTLNVQAGTYDIISEYKNEYGENFFETYSGYQGEDDKFLRGLWCEDITINFAPGAKVICKYTGSNELVSANFSAFATGNNVTIDGLVLDSENLRYGIHADYNTGSNLTTFTIRNSDLRHYKPGNEQAIGAGFGVHVKWLIENTVFRSSSKTHVFRVHNNVSNVAESSLVIRNCYIDGDGFFKFNYYSNSPYISKVMVSGCSYTSHPVVAPETTDSDVVNVELLAFNNELRGASYFVVSESEV